MAAAGVRTRLQLQQHRGAVQEAAVKHLHRPRQGQASQEGPAPATGGLLQTAHLQEAALAASVVQGHQRACRWGVRASPERHRSSTPLAVALVKKRASERAQRAAGRRSEADEGRRTHQPATLAASCQREQDRFRPVA